MFNFYRNTYLPAMAMLVLLAVTLLSAGWTAAFAAKPATATAIEIVAKGDTTRFFAELSRETGFTANVLSGPYRVVIELENVKFDLPQGAGHKPGGLILQVRYGRAETGKSQIVIDTAGPVLIKRSQILPKKGRAKPRIAIDLVATTEEAFAATLARDEAASSPETTASLPVIMPPAKAGDVPPRPRLEGKHLIVLDPGHGGMDPGAVSPNKTKEKDVVFAFAQDLAKKLVESGLYEVRMTRDEDQFTTLSERVNFTRKAGADLFIAIHADTVRGQTVTGTTLYTLSDTASDDEAAALAQKENKADIIAGIDLAAQEGDVADVLINLVQRESKNHANLFSRMALEDLKGITTMTGKPIRSAGFMVLKSPDVPSVLIELGYLSNHEDELRLINAAWRGKMADGLTRAIGRHFAAMDAAEQP
jgi:N-acetylmuramoyl-L-alanine amidase